MKFVDTTTEAIARAVTTAFDGNDVIIVCPRHEMARQAWQKTVQFLDSGVGDDSVLEVEESVSAFVEPVGGSEIRVMSSSNPESFVGLHVHELFVVEPKLHDEEFFLTVAPNVENARDHEGYQNVGDR